MEALLQPPAPRYRLIGGRQVEDRWRMDGGWVEDRRRLGEGWVEDRSWEGAGTR